MNVLSYPGSWHLLLEVVVHGLETVNPRAHASHGWQSALLPSLNVALASHSVGAVDAPIGREVLSCVALDVSLHSHQAVAELQAHCALVGRGPAVGPQVPRHARLLCTLHRPHLRRGETDPGVNIVVGTEVAPKSLFTSPDDVICSFAYRHDAIIDMTLSGCVGLR
ncbi:hypothetical protein EYF80_021498 [Liparis tanakae]|uniref:Uncharacterized protein n=1 Tax=Liparis tanakae TaxID=230148 RepID=A0A4Z2HSQ8_9TELE|nr:hypothetical protein EYF80_021498 [Liparis tanakae]